MVLGGLPVLRLIDVLLGVFRVPQREPEVVVVKTEDLVVFLHHPNIVGYFGSYLVQGTVDVGVIHRQHPDP